MPTPPKPAIILEEEKISHRTKAELDARKRNEAAILTGESMRERPEVKADAEAHKEFTRLRKLMRKIQKDDAITGNILNRYCQLQSECVGFERKRETFYAGIDALQEAYENEHIEACEYFRTLSQMQNSIIACDKQVMAKRKMMLDIEKESLMTIASGLRNIPKRPEPEEIDPMEALMNNRPGGVRA